MEWLKQTLGGAGEDFELLQSTSRKVMTTTGAIYLAWHAAALLFWPSLFSPSLWVPSLMFLGTYLLAMRLLPRHYFIGQAVWFTGLTLVTLQAFILYPYPEILFLLALLPMMAEVTLGLRGTLLVGVALILAVNNLSLVPFIPLLSDAYPLALTLAILAAAALGWGLSDNLISAIDAASYHHRLAVQRLEETRSHRAEISVLLNEKNKANYQLERLNRMLELARTQAEEAREDRERFAMAVSHELRSPLNFIIGFSDLVVNSPETYGALETWPPGLYDDIQEIYRSSTHLLGLINDILDMGKIDAQQMTLLKERADMAAIIAEVRQMVESPVHKKGLELKTDVAPGLPEVYVDRTRIRQVLINLVTNALRFTTSGSITLRALRGEGDLLRVEVEDTGSGISQEDQNKIFEEFLQAGNQNWQRNEGSGLGLAIGRRFVQLHGGEMGVHSELGRGSIFYFTLPVQERVSEMDALSREALERLERSRRRKLDGGGQETLLLYLTPDHFWARIFSESLQGYSVMLLRDPAALAATTARLYPRAVLIDPTWMDDAHVRDFIAHPPYDLPVLKVGLPASFSQGAQLPQGAVAYLVKPVARPSLLQAVQSLGEGVRRLLLVDDDPAMLRYLSQTLKAAEQDGGSVDYECISALNGAEALTILTHEGADAVLLDLDLPDMDGLRLLDRMQQEEVLRGIPVVIVSANDLPQRISLQQTGELQVLLQRPFTRKEAADVIQAVVENLTPRFPGADAHPPETGGEG